MSWWHGVNDWEDAVLVALMVAGSTCLLLLALLVALYLYERRNG